jgi:Polyketide cyclase / dehydrase and lipid transport
VANYSFVTIWRIEAPIDTIYKTIQDSLAWPSWWHEVTKVEELQKGDERGIGSVRRYVFKGKLPYTLAFNMRVDTIDEPTKLAGTASGELAGTGVWTLTADGPNLTTVRNDWNVRTTSWWMNLLAPLARRPFRTNHEFVMSGGLEGLTKLLGVKAISFSHT